MGIQFRQAIPIETAYPMMEAPASFRLTARVRFEKEGWAGLHVGVDQDGSGFAIMADAKNQCVHFMELKHGAVRLDRGMRRLPIRLHTWYPMQAQYDGKVLRLWFNENPLDEQPWPKFEFPLELKGSGCCAAAPEETAVFADVKLDSFTPAPASGETFTNPVLIGADPDILLHNGRYYIYNRVPNDPNSSEDAYLAGKDGRESLDALGDVNAIFRVASSEDLVHWTPYRTCLSRAEHLKGAFCMSPNVFTKDGWFYLLFAAGRLMGEESFHIYYAVSRSPEGPFEMKTLSPLHKEQTEIGGMPFVDLDGQCYITYVRFDRGNNIFLQRLQVKDGVITPEDDTLVPVLRPEMDYEVDEYGRIVEGGVIIPHNGLYYMIYADGHYLGHYGESYAVADNVFGPYRRYAHNPILHHHMMADGTGDGIVIYNADRTKMYMGYHRHQSINDVEPRMTCIDPMKFVPDPDGGPDLLVVRGPSVVPQAMPFQE